MRDGIAGPYPVLQTSLAWACRSSVTGNPPINPSPVLCPRPSKGTIFVILTAIQYSADKVILPCVFNIPFQ